MTDTLALDAGVGGGRGARRDFLRRPVVDDLQGRCLQTAGALVLRKPAAADEHCSELDFILSRTVIGRGCCFASWDLSWHAWW